MSQQLIRRFLVMRWIVLRLDLCDLMACFLPRYDLRGRQGRISLLYLTLGVTGHQTLLGVKVGVGQKSMSLTLYRCPPAVSVPVWCWFRSAVSVICTSFMLIQVSRFCAAHLLIQVSSFCNLCQCDTDSGQQFLYMSCTDSGQQFL